MDQSDEFDLAAFQRRVIKEYKDVNWVRNGSGGFDTSKPDARSGEAFTERGFLQKIIARFAKGSLEAFLKRPENEVYAEASNKIIRNSRFTDLLCPELAKISRQELLPEEMEIAVIKLLTTKLTDSSTSDDLSVRLDPRLFAYMADDILRLGIDEVCRRTAEHTG